MIAQALDAIRAVFGAEITAVVELHFVGEIAAFFRFFIDSHS